jgi:hypothetical protein
MRDFAYVLTLAGGFMPPSQSDAPARRRIETAPTESTPRAPERPRPLPAARFPLPEAGRGH